MQEEELFYNKSILFAVEYFNSISKEFTKVICKKLDMSIKHNEFVLLEEIYLNPGIIQGDLSRKISMQRTYASKILNNLEIKGLIIRKQVMKTKRLAVLQHYLTDKGLKIYKKNRELLFSEVLKITTDEERTEIDELTLKILNYAKKIKETYNIKF